MINKQNYEHETIHDIDKYFITHQPSDLKYLAAKQNRIVVDYQAYSMMITVDKDGNKHYLCCEYDSVLTKEIDVLKEVNKDDFLELLASYAEESEYWREEFENVLEK
ncbi:hypothetical protein P5663_06840 [Priestia flexa]|uniref:hypothetical protein n=1 Tax=Priestia flexa TaxID=86664 RepID=UPI00240CF59B|nr:hypothetical protein [Priestia flexa]WEZ09555.1 hypothetical protein P5663_06840 [Priestia flexa]